MTISPGNSSYDSLIDSKTAELSREYGIESSRVRLIFYKTAKLDWVPGSMGRQLSFSPSLPDALRHLPSNDALRLFKDSDLDKLAEHESVFQILTDRMTPLYSLSELERLTELYARHLRRNRYYLDSVLRVDFTESPWLNRLMNLCTIVSPDEIPPDELERGWSHQDRVRIGNLRNNLKHFEIHLMDCLLNRLKSRKPGSIRDDCTELVHQLFPHDDFSFWLFVDRCVTNYDVRSGCIIREHLPRNLGRGVGDLLELAGHYEEEMTVGYYAKIRGILGVADHLEDTKPSCMKGLTSYYEAIADGYRDEVDCAIGVYKEMKDQVSCFWHNWRAWLVDELIPEVIVKPPTIKFQPDTDYRNITFRDKLYHLSITQARIVKVLHIAYLNGETEMPEAEILAKVDEIEPGHSPHKVYNVFRKDDTNTIIIQRIRPQVYRLNI